MKLKNKWDNLDKKLLLAWLIFILSFIIFIS